MDDFLHLMFIFTGVLASIAAFGKTKDNGLAKYGAIGFLVSALLFVPLRTSIYLLMAFLFIYMLLYRVIVEDIELLN